VSGGECPTFVHDRAVSGTLKPTVFPNPRRTFMLITRSSCVSLIRCAKCTPDMEKSQFSINNSPYLGSRTQGLSNYYGKNRKAYALSNDDNAVYRQSTLRAPNSALCKLSVILHIFGIGENC